MYGCNWCNYEGKLQGNLKRHKESKYEDVRYGCDHCDYKATQQRNLNMQYQSKLKCKFRLRGYLQKISEGIGMVHDVINGILQIKNNN